MTKEEFHELARNMPFEALIDLDTRLRALEDALAPAPTEPAPAA